MRQMGDSPELANELADLIKRIKTASCGSFASYQQEESAPRIGSYNIILDGQNVPVCVIRLISMQLVRFVMSLKRSPAKKVKAI